MKPETYWEKRAMIHENALSKLMQLIAYSFPHLTDNLAALDEAWGIAIDKLESAGINDEQ